jgi:hypothetical protein
MNSKIWPNINFNFPISVVAKQMAAVLSRIYPLIVSKEISAKDFNGWEQMPVQVRESS